MKSSSAANDNGCHQMRHMINILIFPKQHHSNFGKIPPSIPETFELKKGYDGYRKVYIDAFEDWISPLQFGVFGNR